MATNAARVDVPRVSSGWVIWTGRVLSALPVLMLGFGSVMALVGSAQMMQAFTQHFGYPASTLLPIAVAEMACAVLMAIPRTAVLGAILTTGYLGGAIATHVRVGESFLFALAFGIIVWAGLYLRDRRLRALVPLRSDARG